MNLLSVLKELIFGAKYKVSVDVGSSRVKVYFVNGSDSLSEPIIGTIEKRHFDGWTIRHSEDIYKYRVHNIFSNGYVQVSSDKNEIINADQIRSLSIITEPHIVDIEYNVRDKFDYDTKNVIDSLPRTKVQR